MAVEATLIRKAEVESQAEPAALKPVRGTVVTLVVLALACLEEPRAEALLAEEPEQRAAARMEPELGQPVVRKAAIRSFQELAGVEGEPGHLEMGPEKKVVTGKAKVRGMPIWANRETVAEVVAMPR